jgi:hypothetical protein
MEGGRHGLRALCCAFAGAGAIIPAKRQSIGWRQGGRGMAVYVDDMAARFGRMIMCHMIADTDEDLHEMACRIGVARKWFQGDHYDICLSKRRLALSFGAIAVSRRELGRRVIARRRLELVGGGR